MPTVMRSSLFQLLVALALLPSGAAQVTAQTVTPSAPPSPGLGTTAPLGLGSSSPVGPAGIPLGSTEIATPGTSFAPLPSHQFGAGCAGPSASSAAPFDGGGLSPGGQATAPCQGQANTGVAAPSGPARNSIGIPLGSTELGNAGVSSGASVPLPSVAPTGPNITGATSPCATSPSIPSSTAAFGGC